MQNFSNKAIIAKIRSIYGKQVSNNQLRELANCKNVETIASYLKNNTCYKNILQNIDENTIHRGQLENLLKQQNFNNYEKIYRYANDKKDVVFKIIIREFELLEILRIIVLLKANNPNKYIIGLPGYLISKCEINLLALARVENFENLLTVLRNTKYFKVLKKFTPTNNNKIDYAACEHALYEQFFKNTFELADERMARFEKLEFKKLITLQIDYLNICSIYREKVLFNSNDEKIKRRIFPFHRILNNEKIKNLIDSKNDEEFESKLKQIFKNPNNLNEMLQNKNHHIESYFAKLNHKICKQFLHLSSNVSIVFYAFHELAKIEISNLIYAIEGVRYGVSAKEIEKLFIT